MTYNDLPVDLEEGCGLTFELGLLLVGLLGGSLRVQAGGAAGWMLAVFLTGAALAAVHIHLMMEGGGDEDIGRGETCSISCTCTSEMSMVAGRNGDGRSEKNVLEYY